MEGWEEGRKGEEWDFTTIGLFRSHSTPFSLSLLHFQLGWVIPANKIGHVYLASFYLCFTTITSVGYGDIYPINNSERMVAVR